MNKQGGLMSKCVLLSVRPRWCKLIANGKKTIEVRKTRPKLETPFKCYIYRCLEKSGDIYTTSGKVIGEFVCDKITNLFADSRFWLDEKLVEQACLTGNQIRRYANGKESVYGWNISDLVIYDKPMELSEFYFPPEKYCEKELCGGCPHDQMPDVNGEYAYDCEWRRPITRAPQSWCYVEEYDGKR